MERFWEVTSEEIYAREEAWFTTEIDFVDFFTQD